jgi:P27 family predicted phage terminase small subunit
MSNRPKPTALKKLLGNPGKRKIADSEPKPAAGVPEMPTLSRAAAAEWKRIVPLLMSLGILTVADGPALAIYCAAFARWQQAERQLARSPNLASDKARRLFSIAEKSMKLAKSVLIEFGLTPASRPRLASNLGQNNAGNPVDNTEEFFSDPRSNYKVQ